MERLGRVWEDAWSESSRIVDVLFDDYGFSQIIFVVLFLVFCKGLIFGYFLLFKVIGALNDWLDSTCLYFGYNRMLDMGIYTDPATMILDTVARSIDSTPAPFTRFYMNQSRLWRRIQPTRDVLGERITIALNNGLSAAKICDIIEDVHGSTGFMRMVPLPVGMSWNFIQRGADPDRIIWRHNVTLLHDALLGVHATRDAPLFDLAPILQSNSENSPTIDLMSDWSVSALHICALLVSQRTRTFRFLNDIQPISVSKADTALHNFLRLLSYGYNPWLKSDSMLGHSTPISLLDRDSEPYVRVWDHLIVLASLKINLPVYIHAGNTNIPKPICKKIAEFTMDCPFSLPKSPVKMRRRSGCRIELLHNPDLIIPYSSTIHPLTEVS